MTVSAQQMSHVTNARAIAMQTPTVLEISYATKETVMRKYLAAEQEEVLDGIIVSHLVIKD